MSLKSWPLILISRIYILLTTHYKNFHFNLIFHSYEIVEVPKNEQYFGVGQADNFTGLVGMLYNQVGWSLYFLLRHSQFFREPTSSWEV